MEVIHDEEMLREYMPLQWTSPERPILIDRFLENAIEAEADAIADGTDAFVPAVMEHIELAGIHSGDSACVIPPVSIPATTPRDHQGVHEKNSNRTGVVGLMNIQYAIADDTVYILEANPRASRTVPLVSKVCNIPMARIATQVMLGKKLATMNLKRRPLPHFGVKEAVFPFYMFPEVDPLLGPEMRSTGEVLGMADSYGLAFFKAQEAASATLPRSGTLLLTVSENDRQGALEVARRFSELGFSIKATVGTHAHLTEHGIDAEPVLKLHEGRPNITDAIKNGEIQLVVNTPSGRQSIHDDSYIRKAAIQHKVPYITTIAAAIAAAKGIDASRAGRGQLRSLQEYHRDIAG
jgi:carbamoyl-phosphate synthase large subunit